MGFQAHRIKGHIIQFVILIHYQNDFVVIVGPAAVDHIVLIFQHRVDQLAILAGQHLAPQFGGHSGHRHRTAHTAGHILSHTDHCGHIHTHILPQGLGEHFLSIRIDDVIIRILGIHQKIHIIGILNTGKGIVQTAFGILHFLLQIFLKGFQIIFCGFQVIQRVDHIRHYRLGIHRIPVVEFFIRIDAHKGPHQSTDIHRGGFQGQGIGCKCFFLLIIDKNRRAVRNRKDQRNADNTDRTGKCGKCGTAFFGKQVLQGQTEGGHPGHRGFPHPLLSTEDRLLLLFPAVPALCIV